MGVRNITGRSEVPQTQGGESDVKGNNPARASSTTNVPRSTGATDGTTNAQRSQLKRPSPSPDGILSGLPQKPSKGEESEKVSEKKFQAEENERAIQKEADREKGESFMVSKFCQFMEDSGRRIEEAARQR
ncbi:hypothetical protein [Burkholderia ubonensis]|uniref:hypothetical protein n=1 Tax=Burkholderia ubonensis TaxID=101571 RepID=UPI0012F8A122|nr:hypothetical protein [Burkholderia ubonensis]